MLVRCKGSRRRPRDDGYMMQCISFYAPFLLPSCAVFPSPSLYSSSLCFFFCFFFFFFFFFSVGQA
ncbi:uncharacterized protein ARB_05628 [Trichophyton benhamiae CBS 112371]|uniref:Uncharacterized protein n=1 Tax=Arthroderma benhamiae (strain ATCC MYA-4681 / CBS 112371) TaxID=663331 RepID=D4AN24_ARTBC|nr:uncharacterized protein ARB_05628 [Trichophyton benhamiae CBS 112371]EFE35585.1 hypothetical protein ARB_05628 [Trichophyton benhamiae CBS 112371]